MIERRSFDSLGGAYHGWLDAKHRFSFAEYHDPARVHWRALPIRTDAQVLGAAIKVGETVEYRFADASRHSYLVPAKGKVEVNDVTLEAARNHRLRIEVNHQTPCLVLGRRLAGRHTAGQTSAAKRT
ncbi:hypothetical protein [Azomonas macrocytogenes]|uniref:Redox-sensitive bicupin YhaK (Pirin superfamily) n=1 Tax=Azomonas macrocytogenes TaxID=69962 RepID=A0A839T475_AZOMA|nr:hypothetical protein [Azomonas macrocytogenes]MBB3104222.1 redox-sensitive bicupin YhaK (pirin superfamily) [Azomonas macrocytogenes]